MTPDQRAQVRRTAAKSILVRGAIIGLAVTLPAWILIYAFIKARAWELFKPRMWRKAYQGELLAEADGTTVVSAMHLLIKPRLQKPLPKSEFSNPAAMGEPKYRRLEQKP